MPRRSKGPGALQPGTPLADNPVPSQTYGEAGAQRDAMATVPMASGQVSAPIPPPGSNPLIRPTERPNEPVTAGLPVGPGEGREALAGAPTQSVADQLRMLSQGPNSSPTVEALANLASTLGM